ncbi:MAG: hypothetical protein QGH21_05070 [Candidatus Poseidoniia archaeon]|nr:hypothetical protein [Candidatus Poseidoniia archaeon]
MGASGLQCRVGLGVSRAAAQRDDGHGGDSGGQRQRGDAFLIVCDTCGTHGEMEA